MWKTCGKPDVVPGGGRCYNIWWEGGEHIAKYERRRQAKWDDGNLRTVSTRLTKREALALDELCERHGITKFWLVKRFLLKVLAAAGFKTRPGPAEKSALEEELEAAGVQLP